MNNWPTFLVIITLLGLAVIEHSAGREIKTDERTKVSKDNKNISTIERDGKKYSLEILEKEKKMTVTDENGTIVTISAIKSGNYNVRLPNNWGYWQTSLDAAVDSAIRLCLEAQTQRSRDQAFQEMVKFVRDKGKSQHSKSVEE